MTETRRPNHVREYWTRTETLGRWHQLWIEHLRLQGRDGDADAYQAAATEHLRDQDPDWPTWTDEVDAVNQTTRHEVVAALQVFNEQAGLDTAHIGLASSDIVDPVTQTKILDSLRTIIDHAIHVAEHLCASMLEYRDLVCVARTHGQPAQYTTYGHRQATVLGPLLDWLDRACDAWASYPLRPPTGAVGTGADLIRVLGNGEVNGKASTTGLGATPSASEAGAVFVAPAEMLFPDGPPASLLARYGAQLSARLGQVQVMDASRQVYHRSYDEHIASLLSQLASIARTWATDRRLESMLGLGNERHLTEQSASSSMASKLNPRFNERICALAVVTRCYAGGMAELSGMEWLEGDVSGSAARRLILPSMFSTIDDLLSNWVYAAEIWRPDKAAIADEVFTYRYECATAAIMQDLIDAGVSRTSAHVYLRQAWAMARRAASTMPLADRFELALTAVLAGNEIRPGPDGQPVESQLRAVVDKLVSEPIGNVSEQIDWLEQRVRSLSDQAGDWTPEVKP